MFPFIRAGVCPPIMSKKEHSDVKCLDVYSSVINGVFR